MLRRLVRRSTRRPTTAPWSPCSSRSRPPGGRPPRHHRRLASAATRVPGLSTTFLTSPPPSRWPDVKRPLGVARRLLALVQTVKTELASFCTPQVLSLQVSVLSSRLVDTEQLLRRCDVGSDVRYSVRPVNGSLVAAAGRSAGGLLPDPPERIAALGAAWPQRELGRYLFSTPTAVGRVEADTEVTNVAEQRSLEGGRLPPRGCAAPVVMADGGRSWRDTVRLRRRTRRSCDDRVPRWVRLLRRPAQRRQVDADQCPGRAEGRHHLQPAADHPACRARHRAPRGRPADPGRHPRPAQAAHPARRAAQRRRARDAVRGRRGRFLRACGREDRARRQVHREPAQGAQDADRGPGHQGRQGGQAGGRRPADGHLAS